MGKRYIPRQCGDCGCLEGERHELFCDYELCPFCGGQLISCDCAYKKLKLFDNKKYTEETYYLPCDTYELGLNTEQKNKWIEILEEKGRIPYIRYPNICAKCGNLWPDFFLVYDDEWNFYIEPHMRSKILCRKCYDTIKQLIDKGTVNKEKSYASSHRSM